MNVESFPCFKEMFMPRKVADVSDILLLCFCSFDLFCPLFDKDIFIENVYIVLSN